MILTLTYYVLPTILILIGIRKIRERKWGKCINTVQLNGKLAIVTGANSGIGYELAKELAIRKAQVILACRNMEKAIDTANRLKQELCSPSLIPMELDLGSLKSIQEFTQMVIRNYPHVHLLINNGGVSYPKNKRIETVDGFEIHFGVNYLGHFYLTNLLLETLSKCESRVVIVASSLYERGKINLNDLNSQQMEKKCNLYANSKLACVYFGQELARRTKGCKVCVYSVCPGWVFTSLFRYSLKWYHYILISPIAFLYMRSPKQGAQTPMYCATEPELINESGHLYRDCKHYNSKLIFHNNVAIKLWENSEQMIEKAISRI